MGLIKSCKTCSNKDVDIEHIATAGLCKQCSINLIAYNRYYDANINIEYWEKTFAAKFVESMDNKAFFDKDNNKRLKPLFDVFSSVVINLSESYNNGKSFCLAGPHGVGKTILLSNVLKKAVHKNYTALYTTLSDVVSALTLASGSDKYSARKELTEVDFLVIDELDPRFIGSESAADLFGRTFENILRTRLQNKLPTFVVSNSPNPIETFNGALKESLSSLMTKLPLIPILGADFRKQQGPQ